MTKQANFWLDFGGQVAWKLIIWFCFRSILFFYLNQGQSLVFWNEASAPDCQQEAGRGKNEKHIPHSKARFESGKNLDHRGAHAHGQGQSHPSCLCPDVGWKQFSPEQFQVSSLKQFLQFLSFFRLIVPLDQAKWQEMTFLSNCVSEALPQKKKRNGQAKEIDYFLSLRKNYACHLSLSGQT